MATDWNNIDLDSHEVDLELVSSLTFSDFLTTINSNLEAINASTVRNLFNENLKRIVEEARGIFASNMKNITTHAQRDRQDVPTTPRTRGRPLPPTLPASGNAVQQQLVRDMDMWNKRTGCLHRDRAKAEKQILAHLVGARRMSRRRWYSQGWVFVIKGFEVITCYRPAAPVVMKEVYDLHHPHSSL